MSLGEDPDHFYRPGMTLRPIPPGKDQWVPIWGYCRKFLLGPWQEVGEQVTATPQTRLFDDHMWQGDELMDGVAAIFSRIGSSQARQLFEQALVSGISSVSNPPEELTLLFDRVEVVPDWYDREKADRGRIRFLSTSLAAMIVTLAFALYDTALNTDVSTATGATGRFRYDGSKRIIETVRIFAALSAKDGAMPGRVGYVFALRVRLMHSLARRGLRKAWGEENYLTHGDPISNAALCGFFEAALSGLLVDHALGRTCTEDELDDVWHYLSYFSHLFGVADEILPRSGREALLNLDYLLARSGQPSEWRAEIVDSIPTLTQDMVISLGAPFPRAWSRLVGLVFAGTGTVVMGPDLSRLFLAGTQWASIDYRKAGRWALRMARISVSVSQVKDQLPWTATLRRILYRKDSVAFQLLNRILDVYAWRKRVVDDYTTHDSQRTVSSDFIATSR